MDNWQRQFSEGFASSASLQTGSEGTLWVIFGFIVVVGIAWYLTEWYRKYQRNQAKSQPKKVSRSSESDGSQPKLHKYVAVPGRFNPLQQKVIQDMIDEFRKQEPLAQAVPSAILEKYTEFFYRQVERMKTKEKDVEEFVNRNYPLREEDGVELDFQSSGSLHLIQSKVLEIGPKTLIVEYNNPVPDFLRKGTTLHLNYHVGKHFLQGDSVVVDVRHDLGLVLRRPAQVTLTSERRYARIGLKKASGTLADARTGNSLPVKVLDLSLEGVRIQAGRPLDKTHIHQLAFEEVSDGQRWNFGPMECVPSKEFLTGTGTYECGLLFLYLDVASKAKLVAFMRHVAQEIQAGKPGARTNA